MAAGRLVALGILIIASPFILQFIFHFIGKLEVSVHVTILIIITGITLVLSSVLTKWRKPVRKVACISLFVGILFLEITILAPYFEKKEIKIDECKGLFPPLEETQRKSFFWNAIGATSCLFTGYFPYEQTELGWLTFFIFYFILPFGFIFAFIYGLMSSMRFQDLLGGGELGKNVVSVLSLVISLYAARVLFGHILLQFLGYGAWGMVAIFIPVFIAGGLERLISKWYEIEEKIVEVAAEQKKAARRLLLYLEVNKVNGLANLHTRKEWHIIPDELRGELQNIISTDLRPRGVDEAKKLLHKFIKGEV